MLWLKAFHLIFMICWFAGLFYLPRLFVYHASIDDQIGHKRFQIMEKRLYYGIMVPAAALTIISGLTLFRYHPHYWLTSWFKIKLIGVILLIIFQLYCGHLRKRFQYTTRAHSHFFYRILNEVPTILLIGIILVAKLRP